MGRLPESDSLQAVIDNALARTAPGRVVWIALSGGLDSSLLLTLAVAACQRHPRPLKALHVHHGLQRAADDFERHCRQLCRRLDVPLVVERVQVELDSGLGLEGAARQARYAAFARHVTPGETLWLAQHRDDQAETFLLAALRGSGVRGLAGMPARREWQGLSLERPLLSCSRAMLEATAEQWGLEWVEDPTNSDESLERNFLRCSVLPLLQSRWPHAAEALARSAVHAAASDAVTDELAALDLAMLGGDPACLPLASLVSLTAARQRLLVRYACQRLELPTPPERRLATLLEQLEARHDAQVRVTWADAEARVWRDTLYLLPDRPAAPTVWQVEWNGHSGTTTPWGSVGITLAPAGGGEAALRLAPRRGGERLRMPGRGRRDLKRLLQEADLPPWVRERVVVAWHQGEPVAALVLPGGRWVAVAAGWKVGHAREGGAQR